MPFYLRADTEQWFSHIKDEKSYIETKFDIYYFCLMVGFSRNYKSSISGKSEVNEFQKNFVKAYLPVQRIIIGLLLDTEMRRLGVLPTEKHLFHKILTDLVDPDSATKLTELGLTRLNEYVSGGYEILSESISTKPYSVESFILQYVEVLRFQK